MLQGRTTGETCRMGGEAPARSSIEENLHKLLFVHHVARGGQQRKPVGTSQPEPVRAWYTPESTQTISKNHHLMDNKLECWYYQFHARQCPTGKDQTSHTELVVLDPSCTSSNPVLCVCTGGKTDFAVLITGSMGYWGRHLEAQPSPRPQGYLLRAGLRIL